MHRENIKGDASGLGGKTEWTGAPDWPFLLLFRRSVIHLRSAMRLVIIISTSIIGRRPGPGDMA
jgi:hypothetical protein